ncbi:hypothetical protein BsWGS_20971 [Bradybaena similaris]
MLEKSIEAFHCPWVWSRLRPPHREVHFTVPGSGPGSAHHTGKYYISQSLVQAPPTTQGSTTFHCPWAWSRLRPPHREVLHFTVPGSGPGSTHHTGKYYISLSLGLAQAPPTTQGSTTFHCPWAWSRLRPPHREVLLMNVAAIVIT